MITVGCLDGLVFEDKQRTLLAVRGRLTVRLVSRFTSLDWTEQENMILFVRS